MRHILKAIFLLTICSSLRGQTAFLKDYDFDKGGYYILGALSESDPNGLADSLGLFYTNDIATLNQIKKEWVFKKPGKKYACGYHYIVHICKDGKSLEDFAINLNCNEIVGNKGYFYFNSNKLRVFKDSFKKMYADFERYDELKVAKQKRDSLLQNKNVLLVETPRWTKYEGTFKFTYVCDSKTKWCLSNGDKILPKLKIEISQKFPNEIFELSDVGGSSSELFVEVLCNKTLSDKFNLYKRDTTTATSLDKWEPFTFGLGWYYIKN